MAGCAARAPPGSEARLSLATFLLGVSVLALPLLTRAGLQGRTGLALYVAGLNALLLLLYRPPRYQVRAGVGRGPAPSGLGAACGHLPPGSGSGSARRGAPSPGVFFRRKFRRQEGPRLARLGDVGAPTPSTRRSGWEHAVGAVQQLRHVQVGCGVSEPAYEVFFM